MWKERKGKSLSFRPWPNRLYMSKFIEHLKEKPEPIRKRLAVISAVVLTLIVVLLWLTILYARSLASVSEGKENVSSPIDIFLKETRGRWGDIQNNFKNSSEKLTESIEELNNTIESISSSTPIELQNQNIPMEISTPTEEDIPHF
jgi:predicted PurR-regulated permease PerM